MKKNYRIWIDWEQYLLVHAYHSIFKLHHVGFRPKELSVVNISTFIYHFSPLLSRLISQLLLVFSCPICSSPSRSRTEASDPETLAGRARRFPMYNSAIWAGYRTTTTVFPLVDCFMPFEYQMSACSFADG